METKGKSQKAVKPYVPRGSYSTPFLGRLLFKITDPNHKTRYPKKGVGYAPLGSMVFGPQSLIT